MDQGQVPQAVQAPAMRTFGVERQWGQLIGTNIRTFDESHGLVCFARQKAFKLKEEITFFKDEARTQPLFYIKARNIIDIAATYDIFDVNHTAIGALKRSGITSSFIQDEWSVLNTAGEVVSMVKEDGTAFALLRRYVDFASYFMPQTYAVTLSGNVVGQIKQRKNPFTVKYDYTVQSDIFAAYPMLCLAIPNMLAIIEARQN